MRRVLRVGSTLPVRFPAQHYEELLRSGRFGPLSVGASRADVLEKLGEPDDSGAFGDARTLLSYGGRDGRDVQIFLDSNEVVSIGAYFGFGHSTVVLDRGALVLAGDTSEAQLCAWMKTVSEVRRRDLVAGAVWVEFENRVRAVFDEAGGLVSVSSTLRS